MGPRHSMTIGGLLVHSERVIEVVDPSTGDVFAEAPSASEADVGRAVAAAAGAFREWATDASERSRALRAAAAAIEGAADELGRLTTLEMGRPLAASVAEAKATAAFFADSADLELSADLVRDDGTNVARVTRRPLGVVAAIVPWNSPLYVSAMKLGPALVAGNTVVLKPSPEAPLAVLRLGELLRQAFPAGVVNVISGGDEVGPWLANASGVRLVSFTGSIGTGKRVAASAGADLKHVVLELGGNDAAIVLDDADVTDVVNALFANAFGNAGQVCSGIKRVYVHESLHAEVVEGLAAKACATKVGPGIDPETQMGPLATRGQRDFVVELVEHASAAGARIVAGGHPIDGPGYFYPPTVVDCADDDLRLVAEEQFGPALPVLKFRDDAEAVARANKGMYGLGGSVWTRDFDRGFALADSFDTGMSWVNTHKGVDPSLPFGGSKWSGIGAERGRWGMDCFTELHTLSGTRASR